MCNVHSKEPAAAVPRSSYHETWFHISILYRLCCCSNCSWDCEWACCKYTGKNLRIPMLKWSIIKPWNEWCNNNAATRTKSNLLATGRDIWAFITGRYLLLLLLSLLLPFFIIQLTTWNWARLNWNKSNQTTVNDGFVSFSLSFFVS